MTVPDFTARPLVYIAGPYAHPDPVDNTRHTIRIADQLATTGHVTPIVPHTSLLFHLIAPHPPEWWYAYDLAVLARCDALYRIPGPSTGADREVQFAEARRIPVFHHVEDLEVWAGLLDTREIVAEHQQPRATQWRRPPEGWDPDDPEHGPDPHPWTSDCDRVRRCRPATSIPLEALIAQRVAEDPELADELDKAHRIFDYQAATGIIDAIDEARARHGDQLARSIERHKPLLDRLARNGDCLRCTEAQALGVSGCRYHRSTDR